MKGSHKVKKSHTLGLDFYWSVLMVLDFAEDDNKTKSEGKLPFLTKKPYSHFSCTNPWKKRLNSIAWHSVIGVFKPFSASVAESLLCLAKIFLSSVAAGHVMEWLLQWYGGHWFHPRPLWFYVRSAQCVKGNVLPWLENTVHLTWALLPMVTPWQLLTGFSQPTGSSAVCSHS